MLKSTGSPIRKCMSMGCHHAGVFISLPHRAGARESHRNSPAPRRALNVGARAISSLIETEGIGDIRRIYETARRDGVNLNLAYIGKDFGAKPHARFDSEYMRRLFEY